jgi:Rhodopirellula transposase DDE domain
MEIPALNSWLKVLPLLNERQRRLYAAQKVLELGHGGLKQVHEWTGLSRPTLLKGLAELRGEVDSVEPERIRCTGGGRKKVEIQATALTADLERLVEATTAGDPMGPLRWTLKSTRQLAHELGRLGYQVGADTVCRLLHDLGYSLQMPRRSKEGTSPPERDAQFRYINTQVQAFREQLAPVISVDAKKREFIGEFKTNGQEWRRKGKPVEVNTYDFRSLSEGVAIPYGTYDLQRNRGFVNVGISHDTAEFAVESIRQWWRRFGRRHYPQARTLLICADGGGSNGSRNRAWRVYLQQFSDETDLAVTVCHYPPGTSKWNQIEHRMFSFISLNWRGQPLVSYETVVNLISHTTTRKGLRVKARLDRHRYVTGRKVTDAELQAICLTRHELHPTWNYTIKPHPDAAAHSIV